MHSTIKLLEMILTNIVEICTIILELFGVAILVFTAVLLVLDEARLQDSAGFGAGYRTVS